jgi:hypothetical protein
MEHTTDTLVSRLVAQFRKEELEAPRLGLPVSSTWERELERACSDLEERLHIELGAVEAKLHDSGYV